MYFRVKKKAPSGYGEAFFASPPDGVVLYFSKRWSAGRLDGDLAVAVTADLHVPLDVSNLDVTATIGQQVGRADAGVDAHISRALDVNGEQRNDAVLHLDTTFSSGSRDHVAVDGTDADVSGARGLQYGAGHLVRVDVAVACRCNKRAARRTHNGVAGDAEESDRGSGRNVDRQLGRRHDEAAGPEVAIAAILDDRTAADGRVALDGQRLDVGAASVVLVVSGRAFDDESAGGVTADVDGLDLSQGANDGELDAATVVRLDINLRVHIAHLQGVYGVEVPGPLGDL